MSGKRHIYRTRVEWTGNRGSGTSGYRDYDRSHEIWAGPIKPPIAGSSDPAFMGDPARWNPEELLVASLSACHKLWYLHLASAAGLVVTAYVDEAEGEMIEDARGGRFTRVVLRPRVTLGAGDEAAAQALHTQAHAHCFVARSVNFEVACEPSVETPRMTDWSWPDEPGRPTMRMVRAGAHDFEVAEMGEGDRLALCLHGFPELHYSWRAQMPLLASLGYRVWAPNQRGYGASARPVGIDAYAVPKLVGDVAALIDASGAKEVLLVAHDWGAAVAWAFAIQRVRPLAGLVIMNVPHPTCFARELKTWKQRRKSWYIYFFQLPRLPERVLARDDALWVRKAFRSTAVDKARFPDAVLDVYARAALRPGALTAMINWYRAMRRSKRPGVLPRIEVPTLMIWGEKDVALDFDNVRGTEDHVRDFTLKTLPNASHWVQQDAPDEVNAILREWLTAKGLAG